MIKAIIFDYDGVIVDSFISVFKTYQKICKHFQVSCPATIDDFRKIYGYNYIECRHNLGLQKKDSSKIGRIYEQEMPRRQHGIFPGISEVIRKLNKKYKLYLVSSTYSSEIIPRLEKFGLKNLFENIYSGADKKVRKSDILHDILRENKYLPTEVMSIGDRAVDYKIARAVGLKDSNIILVSYGWGLDRNKVGQAKIANNPGDILNFIN